jgi:hypothetical protein
VKSKQKMPDEILSRRSFVSLLPSLLMAAVLARPASARAVRTSTVHPDPRPRIDGSKVLEPADLAGYEEVIPIFDGIREFPRMADGIACSCGCSSLPGHRSLLTCYEADGMARVCTVCQGTGKLVVGRAREGQSLEQIRRAVDARYTTSPAKASR